MSEEKIIGKGTWIDKLASELIEREKKLGRNLDLIFFLVFFHVQLILMLIYLSMFLYR